MSDTCKGHCLCGAVQMEGRGAPRLDACHCDMCLHWHGGPALAVVFEEGIRIASGEERIGVYDSSEWATRQFCKTCGSTLFFKMKNKDEFSAQAGLFDLPKGLQIGEHIFIDEKPDWYDFTGDAPRLTAKETFEKYASEFDD